MAAKGSNPNASCMACDDLYALVYHSPEIWIRADGSLPVSHPFDAHQKSGSAQCVLIYLQHREQMSEHRTLRGILQVAGCTVSYYLTINHIECDLLKWFSRFDSFARSLHSVIDIINIFVTDDRLYNAVIELPEKASFVSTVTTLVTSKHFDLIRSKLLLYQIIILPTLNEFISISTCDRQHKRSYFTGARNRTPNELQFWHHEAIFE